MCDKEKPTRKRNKAKRQDNSDDDAMMQSHTENWQNIYDYHWLMIAMAMQWLLLLVVPTWHTSKIKYTREKTVIIILFVLHCAFDCILFYTILQDS